MTNKTNIDTNEINRQVAAAAAIVKDFGVSIDNAATALSKERLDLIFFDYLENRRRQLLGELRDIEKHLLAAGRITKPSLKPVRER